MQVALAEGKILYHMRTSYEGEKLVQLATVYPHPWTVSTEKRMSVSSLSNDAEGSGVTSSVLLSSFFLR